MPATTGAKLVFVARHRGQTLDTTQCGRVCVCVCTLVSRPVLTTSPTAQSVLRTVQPRRRTEVGSTTCQGRHGIGVG